MGRPKKARGVYFQRVNRPTSNAPQMRVSLCTRYVTSCLFTKTIFRLLCTLLPLQSLDWRRGKLRAEHLVPEATGNSKPILVIHEVVLKMIFLQFPPVRRQGAMM